MLLLVFANLQQFYAKPHIPPEKLCDPLLPTKRKIAALQNFYNKSAPLFFWHIQKSGGSSFCSMMRNEYTEEHIRFQSPDCNYRTFERDIVTNFSTWGKYRAEGYLFVGDEPSNSDYGFPKKYHRDLETQILLNPALGERHSAAWDNMVHVVVIREPIEMAISAFNYNFPGMDQSIRETCNANDLSPDACMHEMFRIKDDASIQKHEFFNTMGLNRIRNEILGNYTINTFSLNNDIEEAKRLLRKFHLIIDLSLSSLSASLLQCVLGWGVTHTVRRNTNEAHPSSDIFDELERETIEILANYLFHERLLYGERQALRGMQMMNYGHLVVRHLCATVFVFCCVLLSQIMHWDCLSITT